MRSPRASAELSMWHEWICSVPSHKGDVHAVFAEEHQSCCRGPLQPAVAVAVIQTMQLCSQCCCRIWACCG